MVKNFFLSFLIHAVAFLMLIIFFRGQEEQIEKISISLADIQTESLSKRRDKKPKKQKIDNTITKLEEIIEETTSSISQPKPVSYKNPEEVVFEELGQSKEKKPLQSSEIKSLREQLENKYKNTDKQKVINSDSSFRTRRAVKTWNSGTVNQENNRVNQSKAFTGTRTYSTSQKGGNRRGNSQLPNNPSFSDLGGENSTPNMNTAYGKAQKRGGNQFNATNRKSSVKSRKLSKSKDVQFQFKKNQNRYLVREKPILIPDRIKKSGIATTVVFTFKIKKSGFPYQIELKKSSGIDDLDKRVRDYIRNLQFNRIPKNSVTSSSFETTLIYSFGIKE